MARESVAVPKAGGIETEFGIIEPSYGLDANARFIKDLDLSWIGRDPSVKWDAIERVSNFRNSEGREEDERHHRYFKDYEWRASSNHLLENGARLYLDGEHGENSTPLCLTPRQLLTWNRACYVRIDQLRKKFIERGTRYRIYRNNVAPRGAEERDNAYYTREEMEAAGRNSWGSHLNLTVSRAVPLHDLIERSIPWFVLQLPIIGQGKVGCDLPGGSAAYQISQRADFILTAAGHSTTYHRSIINLRDIPYADPKLFRRFHIIPFDSNMCELAEYLKILLNSVFLMAVEDGFVDDRFEIDHPVAALHQISWDTKLTGGVWLTRQKRSRTTLDCLQDYGELFWEYLEQYHPHNEELKDGVLRFADILEAFRARNWDAGYGKLDWITKEFIIEEFLAKKGKRWEDKEAYQLDAEYANNDHERGIFFRYVASRADYTRLTTDAEIAYAAFNSPPTRSRWIVDSIAAYARQVHSSDYWQRITFEENGSDPVSMIFPDPTRPWDQEFSERLRGLPLNEYLRALKESGLVRLVAHPRVESEHASCQSQREPTSTQPQSHLRIMKKEERDRSDTRTSRDLEIYDPDAGTDDVRFMPPGASER